MRSQLKSTVVPLKVMCLFLWLLLKIVHLLYVLWLNHGVLNCDFTLSVGCFSSFLEIIIICLNIPPAYSLLTLLLYLHNCTCSNVLKLHTCIMLFFWIYILFFFLTVLQLDIFYWPAFQFTNPLFCVSIVLLNPYSEKLPSIITFSCNLTCKIT